MKKKKKRTMKRVSEISKKLLASVAMEKEKRYWSRKEFQTSLGFFVQYSIIWIWHINDDIVIGFHCLKDIQYSSKVKILKRFFFQKNFDFKQIAINFLYFVFLATTTTTLWIILKYWKSCSLSLSLLWLFVSRIIFIRKIQQKQNNFLQLCKAITKCERYSR